MRYLIGLGLMALCSSCTVYVTSADKDIAVDVVLEDCSDTFISPDLSGYNGRLDQQAENLAETSVDPAAVGAGTGSAAGSIIKNLIK